MRNKILRENVVSLRVTDNEKKTLEQIARNHKIHISSLLRDLLFKSGLVTCK